MTIQTQIATFRTECERDGERVPALLNELGVAIERKTLSECVPGYNVCVFSFLIQQGVTVKQMKLKMEFFIRNDPRFVDLHRCYQTLQAGDIPSEVW